MHNEGAKKKLPLLVLIGKISQFLAMNISKVLRLSEFPAGYITIIMLT